MITLRSPRVRSGLVRGSLAMAAAWLGVAAPASVSAQSNIDPRRSLVVTEQPILERFPLERVLDQLVAQSGVRGVTALQLFNQWWDTQNPGPGLGLGRHCDDLLDPLGQPVLNSFPYLCRPAPAEGGEAASDPFMELADNPVGYIPIGLFNRFDIAPDDGRHCGEHRIVYARRSGIAQGTNRNLIIFEAMLPNPQPRLGLLGCWRIARFWAELTGEENIARHAAALERFYFNGLIGLPPVVHVDHFGNNVLGAGQIRTNQFMQVDAQPRMWSLREFKLIRRCGSGTCTSLTMVPVTNKDNPFGPLFAPDGIHARTRAFQASFLQQVEPLAAGSLTDIQFDVMSDRFNTGQSQASGSAENNYAQQFTTLPSELRSGLTTALAALGSALSPDDVVARAQALSCAGCHRLSNGAALGGGLSLAILARLHPRHRAGDGRRGRRHPLRRLRCADHGLPAQAQAGSR